MWPFKHRNLGISRSNHSEPIDCSAIKTRVASELAEKQIEGLQKAVNGRKGATRHLTISGLQTYRNRERSRQPL